MVFSFNKSQMNLLAVKGKYKGRKVSVSIDSSKTNTAITVSDSRYNLEDLIEFNGSSEKDLFKLLKDQRRALDEIFYGADIFDGNIEDLITPKNQNGLEYHRSRYKITGVFFNLCIYFQEKFNLELEKTPVSVWKNVVLGDMNKLNGKKNSVEYIRNKYPRFVLGKGSKDDDGTDAICLAEYLKIKRGYNLEDNTKDIPNDKEITLRKYKYLIFREEVKVSKDKEVKFEYNSNLNLRDNIVAIANRVENGKLGVLYCGIDKVDINDIYTKVSGKFDILTPKVKVVVKRL